MSENDARYVVVVDTSDSVSADISCYQAFRCNAEYWQKQEDKFHSDPDAKCVQSPVGTLCGLNVKIYFRKWRKGLGLLRKEGMAAMCMALESGLLHGNNGAATYLCVKPEDGLSDYVVCGEAYVVLDDGRSPLTAGQAWGLQEMINTAMDIYDMDQENIRRGNQALAKWSSMYKQRKWKPSSGAGGIDIYG